MTSQTVHCRETVPAVTRRADEMFNRRSVVIFTDEHRDVIYFIVSLSVKASLYSIRACAVTFRAQGYDEKGLYFVSITKDMNRWIPV